MALAEAEIGLHKEVREEQEGQMKEHADNGRSPSIIGLVGPMSNYAAPPQLVENVAYNDMEQM